MKYIFTFLCFVNCLISNAQFDLLSALTLSKEDKQNANSIVRLEEVYIDIQSYRQYTKKSKKIIAVLNDAGLNNLDLYHHFDKSTKIKSIEATVYNAMGVEIKKIKRKDFRDISVSDGFSVFNDNRLLIADYTPTQYPFTVVFETEVESSNTAFLPKWIVFESYFEAYQNKKLEIKWAPDLELNYKIQNPNETLLKIEESSHKYVFKSSGVFAMRREDYTHGLHKSTPFVYFKINKFHLEGYDGQASNWKELGDWVYNNLLADTEELDPATIQKIKEITATAQTIEEKIKKVYEFVQSKTRYVSIQVGIGGWKPMLAKDVDRLGYGDCKALSNYTRVLLKNIGIDANYTIIYGDRDKRDILEDFSSLQGNHIILSVPNGSEYFFLECTSQTNPFNFIANFTDDRKAFVVEKGNSKIIHTKEYLDTSNKQITKAVVQINEMGTMQASIHVDSYGTQYDYSASLESKSKTDISNHYLNYFSGIKNIKIGNTKFTNDKNKAVFHQNIELTAEKYGSVFGTNLLVVPNIFNNNHNVPNRQLNRKGKIIIQRGYVDEDEVIIKIPDGYQTETLPNNLKIETKFGIYEIQFKSLDNEIVYKRYLLMKKGDFEETDFEEFRKFKEQISKNDNAKIALVQK